MKKKYFRIINKDNKEWIIPRKNSRIALCIYQTNSKRGILLKKILPIFSLFPIFIIIFGKKLGITLRDYELDTNIIDKIKKNLGINVNFQYSIFMGTPGIHQKVTIQIFDNEKILAYCKMSKSMKIYELFKHEEEYLYYLKKRDVKNIPQCLFCGKVQNNYLFLQSTIKSIKSISCGELNELVINYIVDMCNKTSVSSRFYKSDFYNETIDLLDNFKCIKQKYHITKYDYIIQSMVDKIKLSADNKEVLSFYHGDFTSWNSFINNQQMFVFDFEYSRLCFPKYLDIFHYFTQNCLYQMNCDANTLYKYYNSNVKPLIQHLFSNVDYSYSLYLIYIISFYVKREKNTMSMEILNQIIIRLDLLEILFNHNNL